MKLPHLALAVAGVCVVATALILLRDDDGGAPALAATDATLVPRDALASATRFDITNAGATATLVKGPDGVWVVENYHGLPADFDRLARLIRDLAAAKLEDVASTAPETIARLEFGPQQIVVHPASGTPFTLEIGKASAGGGRFVRRTGDPAAYTSSFNAFLDGSPRGWADTRLATFEPAAVRTIRARFADGATFEATRADATSAYGTTSLPEGRQLDLSTLDRLVTTLSTLRFTDTTDTTAEDAVAAREHERVYELGLDGGATLTFAIGRRPAPPPPPAPAPADGEAAATPPAAPAPQPGPVFVRVAHSDPTAPINAWMQRRAFQIGEWQWQQFPENATGLAVALPPSVPEVVPPAGATPTAPDTVTNPSGD